MGCMHRSTTLITCCCVPSAWLVQQKILREATINPAKYVPIFTNRTIDKKFTKNTANYVIIIISISVKPRTFPSLANIAINQKLTQTEMFLEGSSCCSSQ